uniref:Uncharacterized protein n=1 Tax=Coccidioides posadasii RMSCC 3488 TaxID=454284 RepID=A0A0J6FCJ2_COCPO|nr:hypothetical protein CPAG_07042 [Coccidioides posadasii RMSCC 3488]
MYCEGRELIFWMLDLTVSQFVESLALIPTSFRSSSASDSDGDLNFKPVSCLDKFKKGPLLEGQQLGNVTADIQRVEAGLLRMQVIPAQPAAWPESENGRESREGQFHRRVERRGAISAL